MNDIEDRISCETTRGHACPATPSHVLTNVMWIDAEREASALRINFVRGPIPTVFLLRATFCPWCGVDLKEAPQASMEITYEEADNSPEAAAPVVPNPCYPPGQYSWYCGNNVVGRGELYECGAEGVVDFDPEVAGDDRPSAVCDQCNSELHALFDHFTRTKK